MKRVEHLMGNGKYRLTNFGCNGKTINLYRWNGIRRMPKLNCKF